MAVYTIRDDTLSAIANAIRDKTGHEGPITPAEMAELIDSIIIITDDDLDALIMRSSEVVESGTATSVAAYAFFMHPTLRTAVLPAATTIGDYAFCDCVNLERVTTGATSIGAYAFSGCDALNEMIFGESLSEISVAAFSGCDSLQVINLRNTSISRISPSAFENSGLNTMYLPEARFCTLQSKNAFAGTALAEDGTGGTIYVPRRFRVQYEANSVWGSIFRNVNNTVISY